MTMAAKKTKKRIAAKKNTATKNATDWRLATLARMRKLIEEADPDAVEEAKWKKPSNPKACRPGRTTASSARWKPTKTK